MVHIIVPHTHCFSNSALIYAVDPAQNSVKPKQLKSQSPEAIPRK
jgi:hypothetical protein